MELKGSEKGPDVAQPLCHLNQASREIDLGFCLGQNGINRPCSIIRDHGEQGLRKGMISPPTGIEPGGGGIVPGKDAPISAVNAGERVCFRCIRDR
jgi:hypothetical protein